MARKEKVTNTDSANEAKLDDALKQIEKKFGKGSIMRLGDRPAVNVDVIPSGGKNY